MTAIQRQIDSLRHNALLGQLVRFGLVGGFSTLIYLAVYTPLTVFVFEPRHAVYAVPFAFLVAVTIGFFLHRSWSFKGHSTATPGRLQHVKFVAVQASGMALNALVTWFGTAKLGYGPLVPVIPAVLLATVFTFFLNRRLVFA
ncbi:GtrA family protein [Sphingomonas sp. PAMC 26605]|uniref:GtrA family protein n=1 Tax=Sphingomonas sp. PAMC 26605 TaxID=1112214 RepID=UPI00026CA1E2|nr:GtrA family protein [Sphingomonas sp. PAMC 26605]